MSTTKPPRQLLCSERAAEGLLPSRRASPPLMRRISSISHEILQSSGQPLDNATRAFMEPRFGHDFGRGTWSAELPLGVCRMGIHGAGRTASGRRFSAVHARPDVPALALDSPEKGSAAYL